MADRIDLLAVVAELDQEIAQLDQQGGEAAIGCGPEIRKEPELTRVDTMGGGSDSPTAAGVELHRRDVIRTAGHYYGLCSCGWLSLAFTREHRAQLQPCEVEILLAESAERKRRLIEGAA